MSAKLAVDRLGRDVQAVPESKALPAPASTPDNVADDEPDQLAREVVRAFTNKVEHYRRAKQDLSERPDPNQPPPDWYLESLMGKPPEDVDFYDIERIARVDPTRATERWQEVKAAARRDLESGLLSARALEYQGGSAWERACYLAVRDRLRQAWQPRNDAETLLIDEMAQYEMLRMKWLGVLAMQTRWVPFVADRNALPRDTQPRQLHAAEGTAEAIRMVERLQRLFQTALRALLNLRRGRGTFFVRGSGPVNFAIGQQLNVCAPSDSDE
jgi:hypothetical protein